MHRLCLCATVATQTCRIWQTPRVSSNCKAWVVSLMFFCPSRLCPLYSPALPKSFFYISPSYTLQTLLTLCFQSPCTLFLSPMSFNSIRGQGSTSLPLHPHLLSVFFSCWCNSTVRCRGHHKLTRSLIMVELMSGKERGRVRKHEGDAAKDGDRELIFIFAWRHGRVEGRRDESQQQKRTLSSS